MKKTIWFSLILYFSIIIASAQEYFGKEAEKHIKGAEKLWFRENQNVPSYIKFKPQHELNAGEFKKWFNETFQIQQGLDFVFLNKERDELGYEHIRYQQTYNGIPVFGAIFLIHIRDGKITAINGKIINKIALGNQPLINGEDARMYALKYVNAAEYMWQIPEEENLLKQLKNDDMATYFPEAKAIIVPDENNGKYYYTFSFDIYAKKPLLRQVVFVDAQNAQIRMSLNKLISTDVPGVAVTKYSGTRTITTDSVSPANYRLRETGRGNGIRTYNMQRQTNYSQAIDFTDSDNYWNNFNANLDEAATDAHWGAEMTYDYFLIKHSRNSIDNNGFALYSYVHYDQNYANAFWDGERMTYGDGDNNNPFTALDICGHEITHGLTSFTADLVYAKESGALNESFSDIFGTAIEFFAKPSQANWTCGENIGFVIRNLSNPNAKEDPDTYGGTYWVSQNCSPSQSNDYCGVHTNCGVLNYWFYLTTVGGSGTNDLGNAFNVTGIGMEKAARVAYRMLTVYLTNTSDYADARYYAIISATDLFGACSPEVETVTNAMYAVGLGNPYVPTVQADFTANHTQACSVPFTVQFINQSVNATNYLWHFGDGTTSTVYNPVHTYTALGNYTVKLIASSSACGVDSLIQTTYISIAGTNSNYANMPSSGIGETLTCCTGSLFDSGGEFEDYQDNTNGTITIAPFGAASVRLNFQTFNFEQGYDYLYIYDGPNTSSPLIGQYDGTNLPNGGIIESTYGAITLRQYTDQGVTASGFSLTWQCNMPNSAPTPAFTALETNTCTGIVQFQDQSFNGPTSWLWDFGDGTTSTQQNPIHAYQQQGTYTVSLTVTNNHGSNTLTKNNFIVVNNLPAVPAVTNGSGCLPASNVTLTATGSGKIEWYDMPFGGTLLDTGNIFVTPLITNTTTYYVQDKIIPPSMYVGKPNNSGSGGYFGNASNIHYLIFNAYVPLTIVSVKVYAQGEGLRTILLRDSSMNVLQSATINIPDGESRITLNFNVPAKNKLQLVGDGVPNLYRNNNNSASYPYTIPNMISIIESSASLPPYNVAGNYYYFYDWEVKERTCISPRVPAVATLYDCSGIEQYASDNNYKIFPNPCAEKLFLEVYLQKDEEYSLQISDIVGRTILNSGGFHTKGKNVEVIDVSNLPEGVYMLRYKSQSLSFFRKVVVGK